jgi:hypothetical protein
MEQRQVTDRNKAMAYLKWRAKTLRRILFGPTIYNKGVRVVGLLEYCHKQAIKNNKATFRINKLQQVQNKNLNATTFLKLKQNRAMSRIKNKHSDKASMHYQNVLKQQVLALLNRFRV